MMDRAPRPIEFTVAVHSLSGQTVTSKRMTIQPQEELEIDVKKLLTDLNVDYRGDFLEGTLSIQFKGKGNPLGGRMLVQGGSESWNIGPVWSSGESGQNMVPDRLDTLWYDLGGTRDVQITISNMSKEPAGADLYLDFAGKRYAADPLSFAPYQTLNLSVTEILARLKLTPYKAPQGGLSIVPRGQKPSLIASGKITDPEMGRMTGLEFPLPQLQAASALHSTGVPIGRPSADSPFAGVKDGNYSPHVYVRNLLDSEQTLTLTVEYPGENGPQRTVLDPIRLPGFSTEDIRLDSYYNELPLPLPYCALRIQHNGPPGSLIANVTAVNENNNQVSQIGVANEGNGYAGSLASYWNFDDGTDFIVFLTNMSDQNCRVGFRIEASGVTYFLRTIKLVPHETRYLNLRELRDKQEPDVRGHLIPKDATEGRLSYIRLDNVPMMGRVEEVPRAK